MRKPTAKANRRRSQRQENGLAEDTGGSAQRGSGCLPWAKSDVIKIYLGKYRAECKFRRGKSIPFTRELINKLRGECAFGEIPMFDLAFVSPTGRMDERWVAIPYEVWLKYHNKE